MKTQDLAAIQTMNPSQHLYLEVVEQGGQQYLKCTKKSWLGRLWMWLGFSSASFSKVANYILKEKNAFEQPQYAHQINFEILVSKAQTYHQRHLKNMTIKPALEILLKGSLYLLLEKVKVERKRAQFQYTRQFLPASQARSNTSVNMYYNSEDGQIYVLKGGEGVFYQALLMKLVLKDKASTPVFINDPKGNHCVGTKYEPTYLPLSQADLNDGNNLDDLAKIAVASFLFANLEIHDLFNPYLRSKIGTIQTSNGKKQVCLIGTPTSAFSFYNPHWGNTFDMDAKWKEKVLAYWKKQGISFTSAQLEKAAKEIADIPEQSFSDFCQLGEKLAKDYKTALNAKQMLGSHKNLEIIIMERIKAFKALVR